MSLWTAWNRWRALRRHRKAALRAEEFWRWFESNSGSLVAVVRGELNAEGASPKLAARLAELNRRTTAYYPFVFAVLGRSADSPELVFTAGGNPAGAESVRFLVSVRPPLPDWTIRTFKPPLGSCVVQYGPIVLTPNEVGFNVIDVKHPDIGERTLLLLFVPGLAAAGSDDVRIAATKLIEGVIGEEEFLRWSNRVVMEDRDTPAEKVAGIERRPLHQLAEVLRAADRDL